MGQYLALLRGINVGGKNLIKMAALAECFAALDFNHVRTYIQSGNVIFEAEEPDRNRLTSVIEAGLTKIFNYDSRVVVRSHDELRQTVAQAPKGFGSEPETYRYDVFFLKEPVTPEEVMQSLTWKEGVDQVFTGPEAVYASRLISKATQSRVSRLAGLPVYKFMTIRNWNTTTKLLGMMEAAA